MTTRRSPAEIRRVLELQGTDLELDFSGPAGTFEDADLVLAIDPEQAPRRHDLGHVEGAEAAAQALVNRLKTHKGELVSLGRVYETYGSAHHALIGEPNVERTRNQIKRHVLEALSHEPRIDEIESCRVWAPDSPPRDRVDIELVVRLRGEPTPLSLVVPFFLEGGP
ncbi:MAG: GPW/gp25 family protein [Acidobacteriota bacterium]